LQGKLRGKLAENRETEGAPRVDGLSFETQNRTRAATRTARAAARSARIARGARIVCAKTPYPKHRTTRPLPAKTITITITSKT
jgi:hypothetical protein